MSARILGIASALAVALAAHAAAQLASRPVDEWVKVLDAKARVAGLKTDEVVAKLSLKPGDVVADLGAGSGPFVVPFARAVASKGKVYAVDIDREFFPHIQQRARGAGVNNVVTVLGAFTDPQLPAADVDLAFFHDVLHHIESRPAYLKAVTKYLKPRARIAIIDYLPARSPHADQPALQVAKDQAVAWLADAGFKEIEDHQLFTDKWFVVFARLK